MTTLLALAWPLLIGFILVRALTSELGILPQVCLGAGLGVGAISCCFFLQLETGVPSLLFELLLFAGGSVACWRTGWHRRGGHADKASGFGVWLGGAPAVVLAIDAYGFFRTVSENPYGGWDAWAIWNLHFMHGFW